MKEVVCKILAPNDPRDQIKKSSKVTIFSRALQYSNAYSFLF